MVFSNPVFLFFFLPGTLLLYFISPKSLRNLFLLAVSLVFYAWGEGLYIFVLLGSIAINYGAGLLIHGVHDRFRLWALWGGIAANLLLLGYYKYAGFLLENIGLLDASAAAPPLPIGISFFTFQALSYLIDLYFRRVHVQRNPLKLALYISLFPQLIAGPIVRYSEVEAALADRATTRSDFSEGMHQFVRGLAKKTLIADPMGLVADQVYAIPAAGLSPETAWLGAICYAFQLYFDFSAYSDMAIGLGRIFGFRFPKNFDYPYRAQSVTEFWRRWHMTLSRWFRDYLYIPLGGNRRGPLITYVNLSIVFLATGIWHGAAWTFIAWGAYHGMFLIIERLGLGRILDASPQFVRHVYLILAVIVGWVLFRSETFSQAGSMLEAMFLLERSEMAALYPVARYCDPYVLVVLVVACLLSIGLRPWLNDKLAAQTDGPVLRVGREAWFWIVFGTSIISVGAASYSPFIYFRF